MAATALGCFLILWNYGVYLMGKTTATHPCDKYIHAGRLDLLNEWHSKLKWTHTISRAFSNSFVFNASFRFLTSNSTNCKKRNMTKASVMLEAYNNWINLFSVIYSWQFVQPWLDFWITSITQGSGCHAFRRGSPKAVKHQTFLYNQRYLKYILLCTHNNTFILKLCEKLCKTLKITSKVSRLLGLLKAL